MERQRDISQNYLDVFSMFSFETKFSKVEEDQFVRVSTLNVLTHFASHKVVSLFYTMTGIVQKPSVLLGSNLYFLVLFLGLFEKPAAKW